MKTINAFARLAMIINIYVDVMFKRPVEFEASPLNAISGAE